MRMRMADGFEHFQLAGFNDGDGLRGVTMGKPSKKSSMDSPPSRASTRFCMGTRGLAKTGVPPMISGSE